jgi:hypothetical protein
MDLLMQYHVLEKNALTSGYPAEGKVRVALMLPERTSV